MTLCGLQVDCWKCLLWCVLYTKCKYIYFLYSMFKLFFISDLPSPIGNILGNVLSVLLQMQLICYGSSFSYSSRKRLRGESMVEESMRGTSTSYKVWIYFSLFSSRRVPITRKLFRSEFQQPQFSKSMLSSSVPITTIFLRQRFSFSKWFCLSFASEKALFSHAFW